PWRPAHDEWTSWKNDPKDEDSKGYRRLLGTDAATGATRELARIPRSRPSRGRSFARGIGRASAPDLLWSKDGSVPFAIDGGDVLRLDLLGGDPIAMTRSRSPISDVRASPDGKKVAFA